jgi:geranylgeranyl reductase family protein
MERGDRVTREQHFDVAVVGAGPGGASAAFHLAQKGWRVALFEKSRMPRAKACGDGLGTGSIAMLESMDVIRRLSGFQRVRGVDVRVNGESTCVSTFRSARNPGYGLVVPRSELDYLVAQRAREAGTAWYEGCQVTDFEFQNGRIAEVCYVRGKELRLRTRFVVIADGGHSKLGMRAGIAPHPAHATGYAVRGYYSNVPPIPDLFRLYLPLTDPDSGRALPGYGWVFPLAGSSANIGVGFYPRQSEDRRLNLRHLFTKFLQQLGSIERRMADIRLEGRWIGGTLPSGMDPSRCVANGALVVGDAAGLVDPFTGEGIDTALVSGQFAAEALDVALTHDDPKALNIYSDLLEQRYRDRFQLGERFVKTYSFMWRLLQTTINEKGPLLDNVRRSLFSYNDSSQSSSAALPTSPSDAFCRRVQVEMKSITSSDFPILGRVCLQMQDHDAANLRHALAFWSYQLGGAEPDQDAVTVSACLEIAKLAHSIQVQVIPSDSATVSPDGKTNSSGNSFVVMSGNYLLMKTFSAVHSLGCDFTQLVARAAARLCSMEIDAAVPSLEMPDGGISQGSADPAEVEGMFCGIVCKLAARLSGCPERLQESLEHFGGLLGAAWFWKTQSSGRALAEAYVEEALQASLCFPDCLAKSELLAVAQAIVFESGPKQDSDGMTHAPPASSRF